MAVNDPHFKIRMPRELKQLLEGAAERQGRSLTAEIVHRLQLTFSNDMPQENLLETATNLRENMEYVAKARADYEALNASVEDRLRKLEENMKTVDRMRVQLEGHLADATASMPKKKKQ
ncbi:Arc family DNA-binding protein [Lysobacter enzymogenes]|nr:Arc family DNA-binding protein [Lysobacter enzymogenes]